MEYYRHVEQALCRLESLITEEEKLWSLNDAGPSIVVVVSEELQSIERNQTKLGSVR